MPEINDIYPIFTYSLSAILIVMSFALFTVTIPENRGLHNYRIARRAIAIAYLILAIMKIAEYEFAYEAGSDLDIASYRSIGLPIAILQALLFNYAHITLINIHFFTRRRLLRECSIVAGFILACAVAYILLPEQLFDYGFYLLSIGYVLLMWRYIRIFRNEYSRFTSQMDNYFSGTEAERLKWIQSSYYILMSIGGGALLSCIFPRFGVDLVFTLSWLIYYVIFAVQVINYAFLYQIVEKVLDSDDTPKVSQLPPQGNAATQQTATAKHIESKLNLWLDKKQYLQSGITLEDVAVYIGTNNKYLSRHINQTMNRTFREWINRLRIEEAKRLLLDCPDMNINEIASQTGFAGKSHFSQQFRAITSLSPSDWRKQGKK